MSVDFATPTVSLVKTEPSPNSSATGPIQATAPVPMIEVENLDFFYGKSQALHGVTLKIPAGTTTGKTFRVKGKGIKRKDGKQGDVLVTVEVAVPQKLSDEARVALETYAGLTEDHDPRRDLMTLAGQ